MSTMLFNVPDVISPEQAAQIRQKLEKAEWVDGRLSAGQQAAKVKSNRELKKGQPSELEAGTIIRSALEQNKVFNMVSLSFKVSPPLFNRYEGGQTYGPHIDNAIRQAPDQSGRQLRMRSDLSATLFLTNPEDYDGGELVVEDTYGVHKVKLPAGHMVLYPASSLHEVKPVTRGMRMAAFFWIQSMVRDEGNRSLLVELELAVQTLHRDHPDHPALVQFTGIYNNLLRRWAEV
jgi:PKHD-type hydroxylase